MDTATQQELYVGSQGNAAEEAMPSLSDVAQEAGGAWPAGWYPAEIIEGYQAKSYTFTTEDSLSKGGDSRNLRVSLRVTSPAARADELGNSVVAGATRNTFFSTNYCTDFLTAANVKRIKNNDGDPKDKAFMRLRIALGQLGQIEKAVGFSFQKHPQGHINPAPLIGQKVDVRLSIGEKGYNEVTAFAPAGSRTSKK